MSVTPAALPRPRLAPPPTSPTPRPTAAAPGSTGTARTAGATPPASTPATSTPAADTFRRGAGGATAAARTPSSAATADAPARPDLAEDLGARRASLHAGGPIPSGGSDAFGAGGRDCDTSARTEARAEALYAGRAGNRAHPIDSREGVRDLISRTPQLDGVDSTRTDDFRCGGAATFNAMLLDGNHGDNARALRRVAERNGTTMDRDTTAALSSWERGRELTPNQAARLQDLTYRTGRDMPDVRLANGQEQRMDHAGLNALGMTQLTRSLRAEGAFANTQQLEMFNQNGHWTTVVTHADGEVSHANSWPDSTGRATCGEGRGEDARGPDGGANQRFRSRVLMANQFGGRVYYETRTFPSEVAPGAALPGRYEEWRLSEDRRAPNPPALDLGAFNVRTRDTRTGVPSGNGHPSGVVPIAPR